MTETSSSGMRLYAKRPESVFFYGYTGRYYTQSSSYNRNLMCQFYTGADILSSNADGELTTCILNPYPVHCTWQLTLQLIQ